jgi:cytochrome c5
MPKKWFLVLLVMVTTVIVIAACAQSAESPEATSPETVEAESPETSSPEEVELESPEATSPEVVDAESPEAAYPEAIDAEALINEKCSGCHSASRVFNDDYDRAGWEDVFDDMINKGADVTEEEKALMIDWLLDN